MTDLTRSGPARPDRADHYLLPQIVLHWLVAALVAVQWLSAGGMESYFDRNEAGGPPGFPDVTSARLHALSGGLILVLIVTRLVLRLRHPAPPLPADMPRALKLAAHLDHYALYATLVLLPVTGMLALYVARGAGEAHQLLKTVLIALMALHVLGALFHAFVRGDGVIQRMLWPRRA